MVQKKRQTEKKTLTKAKTPEASIQIPESQQDIAHEQQYAMIAEAAYFIAEQRGFQGDTALEDWLLAEAKLTGQSSECA